MAVHERPVTPLDQPHDEGETIIVDLARVRAQNDGRVPVGHMAQLGHLRRELGISPVVIDSEPVQGPKLPSKLQMSAVRALQRAEDLRLLREGAARHPANEHPAPLPSEDMPTLRAVEDLSETQATDSDSTTAPTTPKPGTEAWFQLLREEKADSNPDYAS